MFHWISRRRLAPPKRLGLLNRLTAQSSLQERIVSSVVQTDPYPYFVAEDVLPAAVLPDVCKHWPERPDFQPEIAHNYTCELLNNWISDRRKREFWHAFSKSYGREISAAAIIQFKPWISALYGDDIEVLMARITLMESDPTYQGHGCHTHHYHDPLWVGTLLLYLDADATGYPGTTMQRYAAIGVDEQAKMAAKTLRWHDDPGMTEAITVDYRQNRLFGMFDSPISYHSVHAAKPNAVGHRRIFRVHLTVAPGAAKKVYGVSLDQYRQQRNQPTNDPTVVAWLARDIERLTRQSRAYAGA